MNIRMKRTVCMIIPALIFVIILIAGCEKQNPNSFDEIIGCWINPVYEDNTDEKAITCYYRRSDTLPDNSEGIKFLKDGTLIERKNAGWCGTPPITYDNYSGEWKIQNNDEIKIDVAYWGGMENKIWKIINITKSVLKIEIISHETPLESGKN
jgi:hypothetical protein